MKIHTRSELGSPEEGLGLLPFLPYWPWAEINNPDPHLVSEQANAMCIHEGFWIGDDHSTGLWLQNLVEHRSTGVLMLRRPVHVSFKRSRPPYTVPVTVGQLLLDSDRLKSKRS
ncbi:unnamed protein product [Boreogadus saida]